jgi:hypothetical protein
LPKGARGKKKGAQGLTLVGGGVGQTGSAKVKGVIFEVEEKVEESVKPKVNLKAMPKGKGKKGGKPK